MLTKKYLHGKIQINFRYAGNVSGNDVCGQSHLWRSCPRGTGKKAEVNQAFKNESERLVSANVPAKILNDAIAPYRKNLRGGLLWQRLVALFRKQLNDHGAVDFGKVAPFEIHKAYRLERFLSFRSQVSVDAGALELTVMVTYDSHPEFRQPFVDGYQLSVIGIFPDLLKKEAKSTAVYGGVIRSDEAVSPLTVRVPVPPDAQVYVLCLRVQGCEEGVVINGSTTQGMNIFAGGSI